MSIERRLLVQVPSTDAVEDLIRRSRSAAERAKRAIPGDRIDVVRFEGIMTRIEHLAHDALVNDGDTVDVDPGLELSASVFDPENLNDAPGQLRPLVSEWCARGSVAVEIRIPFTRGTTTRRVARHSMPQPAPVWESAEGTSPKEAVAERFRASLAAAIGHPGLRDGSEDEPSIDPKGVVNSVLTKELRAAVDVTSASQGSRVDIRVRYLDGSEARRFPTHALRLADAPVSGAEEFRFALLSIRHTEMDAVVDGCWLRNYDISRNRPDADTDGVVHDMTRDQLDHLTSHGPVHLQLFQTGLEPAIVGFYRALVGHLIDRPGSVSVKPMFFVNRRSHGVDRLVDPLVAYRRGRVWSV